MSSQKNWRKQLQAERQAIGPELLAALRQECGEQNVLLGEALSGYTTYRIGGPADVLLTVDSRASLAAVQRLLGERGTPMTILGGGSNMLVQDGGIRGVVLKLGKEFDYLNVQAGETHDEVEIGAATSIGRLIKTAKERGWKNVAPIAGTPGSVGGALRMNAGDRKVWIGDFVVDVTVCNKDGSEQTIKREKIDYGYRQSKFPSGSIIVGGRLRFERGDVAAVRAEIEAHIQKRKDTQPLNQPSGGSVFRNPDNGHAGELIESAGLKGVRLHDAQISDKHANFIVNLGAASSRDVLALIRTAKQKVFEETGVKLEEEIRILGEPLEEENHE